MANKRQQKKQRAKQNIKILQNVGATKKEIKQYRNDTTATRKKEKAYNRKLTARERSAIIKSYGYKVSDYASLRYVSKEKWLAWVTKEEQKRKRKEQAAKRKEKNKQDIYLIIYWRDKTKEGYADTDVIKRTHNETKYLSNEGLVNAINFIMRDGETTTEIGTYSIELVRGSEIRNNENFMHYVSQFSMSTGDINNWQTVYKGKAKQLRPLLQAIYTTAKLMYDALERQTFLSSLIKTYLPRVNMDMAKELSNLFQLRTLL